MEDSGPAGRAGDASERRGRQEAAFWREAWVFASGLVAPVAVTALALLLLLGNVGGPRFVAGNHEQAAPPGAAPAAPTVGGPLTAPTSTPGFSAVPDPSTLPAGSVGSAGDAARAGEPAAGTRGGVAVAGASVNGMANAAGAASTTNASGRPGETGLAPAAPSLARAGAPPSFAPIAAIGAALAALGLIWRRRTPEVPCVPADLSPNHGVGDARHTGHEADVMHADCIGTTGNR